MKTVKSFLARLFLSLLFVNYLIISSNAQVDPETVFTKIADDISGKLLMNAQTTFTVLDFTASSGKQTSLGKYLAEKVSMALSKKSISFKVVDRTFIQRSLTDKGIPAEKANDIYTIKDICASLGIQTIITGNYFAMGSNYELNVKAVETINASLVVSSTGKLAKTADLAALEGENPTPVVNNPSSNVVNIPETPANVLPKTVTASYPSTELKGFKFQIVSIKQSGPEFIIHFLITYTGQENKGMYLYAGDKTRILDDEGNDYISHEIRMGKNEQGRTHYQFDYIPGVPIKAQVVFKAEYTKPGILAFEMETGIGMIQFKNITILN